MLGRGRIGQHRIALAPARRRVGIDHIIAANRETNEVALYAVHAE